MDTDGLLFELTQRLYGGDAESVARLVREALDRDLPPRDVLDRGLLRGMDRVGQDFRDGALFIPEIIVAARAMHRGLEILRPSLAAGQAAASSPGKVVLGTVQGDLHDIGKRLVGIMLESAGFEVVDLGHDVAPDRFVAATRAEQADLVGLSALLSTTMPMMATTVTALAAAGLTGKTRVLVGGAPVTAAWAAEIGAHGYAPDAVSAVDAARTLLGCPAEGGR